MFNSRKKHIVVLLILTGTLLSGCGSRDGFLTNVGSDRQKEISREEYLRTDVAQGAVQRQQEEYYNVYTLKKGTYVEKKPDLALTGSETGKTAVRYDVRGVTARFVGYEQQGVFPVEAGDPIATVLTDVDETMLMETEIKLKRLEEDLQEAETQMKEDLQEILEKKALTYNDYQKWIMDVQYKQRQQDWELEKYNFENQIETARATLDEWSGIEKLYTIRAKSAGVVVVGELNNHDMLTDPDFVPDPRYTVCKKPGDELKGGDVLCVMIPLDVIYQTSSYPLPLGMEKTAVFFRNEELNFTSKVVGGGTDLLYGNLDTGQCTLRAMEPIDIKDWKVATADVYPVKDRTVKILQNVILVPAQAVTEEDNCYYVTVQREDGTFLKTEFLPGGNSDGIYWVLEGLSEGMQIVY